jgi:predicted DNA-binding transcriptional regulator YafY
VQISRLFEIVYLILEKGKVPARELAERFEVTTRTIYRDVESLSAAGIPVYMTKGRNGGLSLLPEFVLDKTVLTQREKDEILSALAGLSATGRDETSGALNKLASLFGDTGYDWIEVDFSGWGWSQGLKDSFSLLKEAVLTRRVLSFDYFGSKGEKTSRSVEPLKLVFRGQSWYLYAYCRTRASDRYFKLSRMDRIILRNESFSRKTPERVISSEPGKPEYEMLSVRFRAFAPIHFRIYDEYPHHCIHEQDDGTLIVETVMPRGEWLHSYFLSYGENIEVLEPTELREALMRVIGAMQARYGK